MQLDPLRGALFLPAHWSGYSHVGFIALNVRGAIPASSNAVIWNAEQNYLQNAQ